MIQTEAFHYPPELMDLLIDTIPVLNKGKQSVLLFFRGAGVPEGMYNDISKELSIDKERFNKYEICRIILKRVNEKGDDFIKVRRELLKRVVEFETFSNCWESDVYKAKGLVAEVRNVVNVKDAFTRIQHEQEKRQATASEQYLKKVNEIKERREKLEALKQDLFSLYSIANPQERGKKLEGCLNRIFLSFGILTREAFVRRGEVGEGIIEQIDGVVEIENEIYLVEVKWEKDKIGSQNIFAHLGRIYHRANAHGLYISESGYTSSAIVAAKEALTKNALIVLADLRELVDILSQEKDLLSYLKAKINKAIIDKDPYTHPQI